MAYSTANGRFVWRGSSCDECLAIKKEYFAGEIDRAEMNAQLRPIEAEIDEIVNKLYGIEAREEIEVVELEEDVFVDEER